MDRMTVLDNIYTAMKHYTDVRGDLVQWTKQNPGIWEVVTYILKMRSLEDASQELSEKYPQSTVEIFDDLIAVSRGNTAILLKYGIKAERPLGEVTSGWIRRQFGLGSYQG